MKKRLWTCLLDLQKQISAYGLKNMQNGNVCNDLYVFCPVRELYNIKGEKESVDVYMRFNIIETGGGKYRALVSLHKRNKPITYLFS